MSELVILGPYARAAAASAARAGLYPCCADTKPSVDLASVARVLPVGKSPSASDWLAVLDRVAPDVPVLLLAPLWSDVELVEAIASGRVLVGTREAGIRKTMAPAVLGDMPALRGIKAPVMKPGLTVLMKVRRWLAGPGESRRWMQAGFDPGDESWGTEPPIKPWQPCDHTVAGHWLVRRVKGRRLVGSFVGDGWSSVMLGVCERITFDLAWRETKTDPAGEAGQSSRQPAPEALRDHRGEGGRSGGSKTPAIGERKTDQAGRAALPDAGRSADQKPSGLMGKLLPWIWTRSPAGALPKPTTRALPAPADQNPSGRATEGRPASGKLPATVGRGGPPVTQQGVALRAGKSGASNQLRAGGDDIADRVVVAEVSADVEPIEHQHRCSGIIGPVKLPRRREPELAKLGVMMAQKFDLRGLFSVEMILDRWKRLRPVTVWPAYSPANEVLESAGQPSALAHPALRLPGSSGFGKAGRQRTTTIAGVAWLTAPRRLTMPDLTGRLDPGVVADIAPPDRVVEQGGRLCSVHVTADTPAACGDLLERLASYVFTMILDLT